MAAARWCPVIMFSCAFFLAWMWYTPDHHEIGSHALSSGVVLTLCCFTIGISPLVTTFDVMLREISNHYIFEW